MCYANFASGNGADFYLLFYTVVTFFLFLVTQMKYDVDCKYVFSYILHLNELL